MFAQVRLVQPCVPVSRSCSTRCLPVPEMPADLDIPTHLRHPQDNLRKCATKVSDVPWGRVLFPPSDRYPDTGGGDSSEAFTRSSVAPLRLMPNHLRAACQGSPEGACYGLWDGWHPRTWLVGRADGLANSEGQHIMVTSGLLTSGVAKGPAVGLTVL